MQNSLRCLHSSLFRVSFRNLYIFLHRNIFRGSCRSRYIHFHRSVSKSPYGSFYRNRHGSLYKNLNRQQVQVEPFKKSVILINLSNLEGSFSWHYVLNGAELGMAFTIILYAQRCQRNFLYEKIQNRLGIEPRHLQHCFALWSPTLSLD